MVNYTFCENCNKVIDEFEDKCGWCNPSIKAKQLVFPNPMTCTHVYPDGSIEEVRYGQYESILITSENCWPVHRNKTLAACSYYVTEVLKKDGTKVIFQTPFYCIPEEQYGDDTNRRAKSNYGRL